MTELSTHFFNKLVGIHGRLTPPSYVHQEGVREIGYPPQPEKFKRRIYVGAPSQFYENSEHLVTEIGEQVWFPDGVPRQWRRLAPHLISMMKDTLAHGLPEVSGGVVVAANLANRSIEGLGEEIGRKVQLEQRRLGEPEAGAVEACFSDSPGLDFVVRVPANPSLWYNSGNQNLNVFRSRSFFTLRIDEDQDSFTAEYLTFDARPKSNPKGLAVSQESQTDWSTSPRQDEIYVSGLLFAPFLNIALITPSYRDGGMIRGSLHDIDILVRHPRFEANRTAKSQACKIVTMTSKSMSFSHWLGVAADTRSAIQWWIEQATDGEAVAKHE